VDRLHLVCEPKGRIGSDDGLGHRPEHASFRQGSAAAVVDEGRDRADDGHAVEGIAEPHGRGHRDPGIR
jgi:hypothetical protein